MTLMRFYLAPNELQFEAGADWPAPHESRIFQVTDRTAAGTLQVETLGIKTRTRILNFSLMKVADYNALLDWYENKAMGSLNAFEFTDEYGNVGNVRIIDESLNFSETFLDLWSGTLTLEYV